MDRYDETAERILEDPSVVGAYGDGKIIYDISKAASILRESFPEPASAEQGEGLTIEAVNAGLAVGLKGDGAPEAARVLYLTNPITYRIAKTISYALASHPQPEAKVVPMAMLRELVNQGYRQLGDKTIKQIVAKHMPGYTVKE
jgi:hypothetical protein